MKIKKKSFKPGDRVVVYGNDEKHGIVDGKYKKLYVVTVDVPYEVTSYDSGERSFIYKIVVHPDNLFKE